MALKGDTANEDEADAAADKAIEKARGRKGADKQEAVVRPKVVQAAIGELIDSLVKAQNASDRFNTMVKKVAEEAGMQASNVKKFVKARAGEAFQERKRDADQMALLFEEVGEKGGR
jgi:hypothetical protein